MEWLVVIALPLTALAFILVGAAQARRVVPDAPPAMSVTLSVLPTRTAVVVLDVETAAPSADLAGLVEHAVRDAFRFHAVNAVEVRRRNGEVLERRLRRGVLSA
jgi:hypothetical protein